MSLQTHTAYSIERTFAAAEREISDEKAADIAASIAGYSNLQAAIQAASVYDQLKVLGELVAYEAALAEEADRNLVVKRLRQEADDLDPRAETCFAEAAEFHGKARARELRGDTALSADFANKALAAEQVGSDLQEAAFRKRLRAAVIQVEIEFSATIQDTAKAVARVA